jgi:hypothetical protein
MTKISSADFMKLTLQEVADLLVSEGKEFAVCRGFVDGRLYNLVVKLELDEEVKR